MERLTDLDNKVNKFCKISFIVENLDLIESDEIKIVLIMNWYSENPLSLSDYVFFLYMSEEFASLGLTLLLTGRRQ